MRFSVLDIDVTGTDMRRDRVRGIAMLPLDKGKLAITDLRYCAFPDPGWIKDADDSDWRAEYQALRAAVSDTPIVTYNPGFVRKMIHAACRANNVPLLDGEWLDVTVAAAVMGSEENELTTLDHWLKNMQAGGRWPHDASYDVFAMAQLLQALLSYAEDLGIDTMDALTRNQSARAWLRIS
jgi:DNA polymerase III alpha subunit (gram-positive type)